MFCSKFNSECPDIELDCSYIFVMMPFTGFNSVYDTIKQAIDNITGKKYIYDRADEEYTNQSLWCDRICRNIRKAKYCIVDTTGKNPNVFYELGFAHAIGNPITIIITQNIEDAPFDVRDFGHIVYNINDLPKLREQLIHALINLDKHDSKQSTEKGTKKTKEIEIFVSALQIALDLDDGHIESFTARLKEKLSKNVK